MSFRAEYQHEDVGDLPADQVDQQVAHGLLDGALIGIGRDLDHMRLGAIAAGAPGEEEAIRKLRGQNQVGRRGLPAVQVGDAAKAAEWHRHGAR